MAPHFKDSLSWELARIKELEEELEEAKDTVHREVDGSIGRWDI
jgi:hypothetical protein